MRGGRRIRKKLVKVELGIRKRNMIAEGDQDRREEEKDESEIEKGKRHEVGNIKKY